jgi:hypothetical protein
MDGQVKPPAGRTAGPTMGKRVPELIAGGSASIDIAPDAAERFAACAARPSRGDRDCVAGMR